MDNILNLKPNIIIGDTFESNLQLDSWKGFQSRQGAYGTKDKEVESDGTVKVIVHGKEVDYVKTTTSGQVNALKFLIENSESVRDNLLNEILRELPNQKEIYGELIPEIETISEFKKVLGLANIHILPVDKDDVAYIGFELGCDWDNEHGVGIMSHLDRVIKIGQADTSFDNWTAYEDNGTLEIETRKWNEMNSKISVSKNRMKPWWKLW